jgi:hypothetical protein
MPDRGAGNSPVFGRGFQPRQPLLRQTSGQIWHSPDHLRLGVHDTGFARRGEGSAEGDLVVA